MSAETLRLCYDCAKSGVLDRDGLERWLRSATWSARKPCDRCHAAKFAKTVRLPAGRLVRCISLWQPWASLIAAKLKHVETRSWPAPSTVLGARIGIHAAKTKKGMLLAAKIPELWKACLENLPWTETGELPTGAIVATAVVEASIPTERLKPDVFGDYSPGRFGWMLADIEPLPEPIAARGMQGVFTARLDTQEEPRHE